MLAALAPIKGGMKHKDAVQFIRQKQCGAFNSKHLPCLENNRPNMQLSVQDSNGHRKTVACNETGA